ncbi:hypothetical protein GS415_06665 [Rhodococcus hoagii]|nr:hypothetical protein [Prescottella equi]
MDTPDDIWELTMRIQPVRSVLRDEGRRTADCGGERRRIDREHLVDLGQVGYFSPAYASSKWG